MTMVGDKTMSLMKKKGQGGEFMKMFLAVYPYEVEFLNNVDYATSFYFQKNYQLIGQMKGIIPTGQKNTKLPLNDINNIIHFRLYSSSNVVYKWSIYRREEDHEEFLDSCTLNLREAVTSFLGPQKSIGLGSHSSIVELGFIHKEMRLKFPKMGAILCFMLYVAADTKQIAEHVQRHMIDHIEQEEIPHPTLLRTDSGKLEQSSNTKFKNNSLYKIKSSDPIIGTSSVGKLQENSVDKDSSNPSKQEDKVKEDVPSDNLENLIMSFDIDGNLNQPIKLHQPETNKEKVSEPEPEQKLSDEIFKEDFTSSKPKEKPEEQVTKEEKLGDDRDYGVLKLQSDQGRIKQDMIDKKLQLEELEAIEEEKPSRECTINQTIFQGKPKKPKSSSTPPTTSIKEETEEAEISQISKFNIKKIGVVLILSIFLFVVAATLSSKIHKKKRVHRHRREK